MPTERASDTRNKRLERGPRASAPAAGPPETDAPATQRPQPTRVHRQGAARRIREASAITNAWSSRERLGQLADRVRGGAGDPQRAEFIEGAIARCLDEAATDEGADRWLACEAATWALGWMARSRRAGGSAGSLLERLVKEALAATPIVSAGDTAPAAFMLLLSRLFSDIEACHRFESVACDAVAAEIDRLVSVRGTVRVTGGASAVERVVRWCRVRAFAHATGTAAWGHATERRWREAATAAVRLLGRHGRMLTEGGLLPTTFTRPLLEAVNGLGRRRTRTVKAVCTSPRASGKPRQFIRRDLHDATAATTVLRTGWDAGSVRVLVDYSAPTPRLEIAVEDRLLVAGPWAWQLAVDGRPHDTEGPWSVSCQESNRSASFLEITAPLPGGRQFERQVILLPKDRVLVLADAVTTPDMAPASMAHPTSNGSAGVPHLRFESTLPLTMGLETEAAVESRDVLMFDTTVRGTALPLALPEWRSAGRGSLRPEGHRLTLAHETAGSRFYAPLWLDLDPRRAGKPLTWRQLTVADSRLILPPHQAAGYRVQIGHDQWLLYRSLDAPRNRTLLGCNVSCDFLVGRIKRNGVVKRLLEIE